MIRCGGGRAARRGGTASRPQARRPSSGTSDVRWTRLWTSSADPPHVPIGYTSGAPSGTASAATETAASSPDAGCSRWSPRGCPGPAGSGGSAMGGRCRAGGRRRRTRAGRPRRTRFPAGRQAAGPGPRCASAEERYGDSCVPPPRALPAGLPQGPRAVAPGRRGRRATGRQRGMAGTLRGLPPRVCRCGAGG